MHFSQYPINRFSNYFFSLVFVSLFSCLIVLGQEEAPTREFREAVEGESATMIYGPPLPATKVVDATRDSQLTKIVDKQAEAVVHTASKVVGDVGTGFANLIGGEESFLGNTFIESVRDFQEIINRIFNTVRRFWWLILPIFFLLVSFFLGYIFDRIIISRLRKFARSTRWKADDVIADELSWLSKYLFIILGVYGFVLSVTITRSLESKIFTLLKVLLIILITIYVKRVAVGLLNLYSKEARQIFSSSSIINNVIIIGIYAFGVLIILNAMNINITPILTALGVGGLAVALALQETLSNLFAGIQIIVSRQLKPGDYIKLATGEEGYVVDITWRNTMVRQLSNNMQIIPNAKIAATNVINFYQPERELSVNIDVGVSYDSDLEKVEKITIEVAREIMKEIPGGIIDFDPFIRYKEFADFSINFSVILRGKEFVDQYLIKHEFVKRLHKRYREEDITIPFPIRTIEYKNIDQPKLAQSQPTLLIPPEAVHGD